MAKRSHMTKSSMLSLTEAPKEYEALKTEQKLCLSPLVNLTIIKKKNWIRRWRNGQRFGTTNPSSKFGRG